MTGISGIQQAFQKVIEQAQNAPVDRASAAPGDKEKFQAAMAQPPAEPQAVNPAGNAEAPAKVEGVAEAKETSPGHRILDSVEQISSGFRNTMSDVQGLLKKGTPSVADLLAVQAKLTVFGVEQELMAKQAGSAEKSLDTLLKGQ